MPNIKSIPSQTAKLWKWFLDSWIPNYVSLALAFASLACIFIILGCYNTKALSSWTFYFSINTVLSILATVMKGSVMLATTNALCQSKWNWYYKSSRPLKDFRVFDDASRGPLGATELLFTLRMWHIASIGALVTLLALLSDIFVQASATFPSRSTTTGLASIPISSNYSLSNFRPNIATGNDKVDPSMKNAISSAILGGNVTTYQNLLTPECTSGNCSFPPYISLGVSSTCENLTHELKKVSIDSQGGFDMQLALSSQSELVLENSQNNMSYINLTSTPNWISFEGIPLHLKAPGLGLSETAIITSDGKGIAATYAAFVCVLYVCVREYSGQVQDGRLVESTREVNATNWEQTFPKSATRSSFELSHELPDGRIARVSINAEEEDSLSNYLGFGIDGTTATPDESPGPFGGSGGLYIGQDVNQSAWSDDLTQSLWINDPLNPIPTFKHVAESMTINMRVRSGNYVRGTALAQESYIHARWGFMTLPAIMVVLALIFVLLTRWKSRVFGLYKWGSNNLADVVYSEEFGLVISERSSEKDIKERPKAILKVSQLEEWAERKVATLHFEPIQPATTSGKQMASPLPELNIGPPSAVLNTRPQSPALNSGPPSAVSRSSSRPSSVSTSHSQRPTATSLLDIPPPSVTTSTPG